MINWFDMPAEGLSNGGEFEIKELEVTENGTYEEKGEMYNKVIVNVEGGGGSSDFSTAEISISGVSESQCSVTSPHIIPTPFGFELLVADSAEYTSGDSITVVLYKGKVSISASVDTGSIAVSGDIEHMDGNDYLVTGDCTITIS